MRRFYTAREQLDRASFWARVAVPLWQKLPTDLDWMEPREGNPNPAYREFSPYDTDIPRDRPGWFHVSPHKIDVGQKITPSGGESSNADWYDSGSSNRGNYVWLSPSAQWARAWSTLPNMGENPHFYQVHPGDTPQRWNFDGDDGWVAPDARVLKELTRDEIEGMIPPPKPEPVYPMYDPDAPLPPLIRKKKREAQVMG